MKPCVMGEGGGGSRTNEKGGGELNTVAIVFVIFVFYEPVCCESKLLLVSMGLDSARFYDQVGNIV